MRFFRGIGLGMSFAMVVLCQITLLLQTEATDMNTPPEFQKQTYNCPHCKALTTHTHYYARISPPEFPKQDIITFNQKRHVELSDKQLRVLDTLAVSHCFACGKPIIWKVATAFSGQNPLESNIKINGHAADVAAMIWPPLGSSDVPPPNDDLDEDIKDDYFEAASVLSLSPRSAAALIRLALQKFLKAHAGQSGDRINNDIGELVASNPDISERQCKIMHTLRIIGNHAVHPGQLDVSSNPGMVLAMFELLNQLAYDLVTRPKQEQALWDSLPASKTQAVENGHLSHIRSRDSDSDSDDE